MPAELERSLEAVPAEGALLRADKGTRIDEVVVDGANAVGATDLSAGPVGALLLGGSGPLRRGRPFSFRSAMAGADIATAESTLMQEMSKPLMTRPPADA